MSPSIQPRARTAGSFKADASRTVALSSEASRASGLTPRAAANSKRPSTLTPLRVLADPTVGFGLDAFDALNGCADCLAGDFGEAFS